MFDLTNKIVLIVGGRGYLGRDFCQALRSQNASVVSADLPLESQAASKSAFNNHSLRKSAFFFKKARSIE